VTAPVFLADGADLGGDVIVLDGPEGRHAATVRRIRPGERADVTDGKGLLAECVVTAAGGRLTQARALARFAACCIAWFAPATLVASVLHLSPWPSLALVDAGVAVYAMLALAEPEHQFWHDRCCGTRLIDVRGEAGAGGLRPRPR